MREWLKGRYFMGNDASKGLNATQDWGGWKTKSRLLKNLTLSDDFSAYKGRNVPRIVFKWCLV